MNGLTSEVRIQLHIENTQQKDRQKEERDDAVQMLLPKGLSHELFAPFLELFVWRFFAQNEKDQEDYAENDEYEIQMAHNSKERAVLHS